MFFFATECHNFRESLRFGRRWVETRTTNPHQTNRLQKTCRESRRNTRPSLSSAIRPSSGSTSRTPQCFSSRSRVARSVLFRLIPPYSASPIPHSFTDFSRVITRHWQRIVSSRNVTWKIAESEKVAKSGIIMHECIRRIKCWKTLWHDGWSRTWKQKRKTRERVSRRESDAFAIEFVYYCSKHTRYMIFVKSNGTRYICIWLR